MQKVSLAQRFALVPLGPPLLAYGSNCKAMLTAADDAVQLVVDRPYKAGESIAVWYVVNICQDYAANLLQADLLNSVLLVLLYHVTAL